MFLQWKGCIGMEEIAVCVFIYVVCNTGWYGRKTFSPFSCFFPYPCRYQ